VAALFKELREGIRKEISRFRNRSFFEATMAASALVAAADGEISFSERHRMDQVLETLDDLRVFGAERAVDRFNDFVFAIRDDEAEGVALIMKTVGRIAEDSEAAALLVRICVAVADADGEYSDAERARIAEICQLLEVIPPERNGPTGA